MENNKTQEQTKSSVGLDINDYEFEDEKLREEFKVLIEKEPYPLLTRFTNGIILALFKNSTWQMRSKGQTDEQSECINNALNPQTPVPPSLPSILQEEKEKRLVSIAGECPRCLKEWAKYTAKNGERICGTCFLNDGVIPLK